MVRNNQRRKTRKKGGTQPDGSSSPTSVVGLSPIDEARFQFLFSNKNSLSQEEKREFSELSTNRSTIGQGTANKSAQRAHNIDFAVQSGIIPSGKTGASGKIGGKTRKRRRKGKKSKGKKSKGKKSRRKGRKRRRRRTKKH